MNRNNLIKTFNKLYKSHLNQLLSLLLSFLMQVFLLCTTAEAQWSQKKALNESVASLQISSKTNPETESEIDTSIPSKTKLVEDLLENSCYFASQFNWVQLWPYLQNIMPPEVFLEAVRGNNSRTVTALAKAISEHDTTNQFGDDASDHNPNIVLYIFSAVYSWMLDAHINADRETIELRGIAAKLVGPARANDLNLVEKLPLQNSLYLTIDPQHLKEAIVNLSRTLSTLFPDISENESIQNAQFVNFFIPLLQSEHSGADILFTDTEKFKSLSGTYVDFAKHIQPYVDQPVNESKLNFLSLSLTKNCAAATNHSEIHSPLVDAFTQYFTEKWEATSDVQLKRQMALLALSHPFTVNLLLPVAPANKTVTDQNAQTIYLALLDLQDSWEKLAQCLGLCPSIARFATNGSKLRTLIFQTTEQQEKNTIQNYIHALKCMNYRSLIPDLIAAFDGKSPWKLD